MNTKQMLQEQIEKCENEKDVDELIANANDPDHADYINPPATCGIFDATTDAGVVTVVEFTLVP